MDHITTAMDMVDYIDAPAFCVRDDIIVKVNPAGAARMIESGTKIDSLLCTGRDEYAGFREGSLHLTLSVCGQTLGATLTRKEGFDLFLLEKDPDRGGLAAMALAAREIREPLHGLKSCADLLLSQMDLDDEQTCEQVAQLRRYYNQLHRITSNLSDAIRYATGSGARQEVRDVCAIIREIIAKFSGLVEGTGIRITSDIHPEPVDSLVNAEQLERAIYNILENAVKFTPEDGHIHISLTRRGSKLYFSVSDSGCGIAEHIRGNIFSRYTREPSLETGPYGIGMGLVLVREAAAHHGGNVLVDHPEGTGTRVTMTLAIRPGTGKELRSPALKVDYAGERDHALLELSHCLPASAYDPRK